MASHTLIGTAGNLSDSSQANAHLHGEKADAVGDTGYTGVKKYEESKGRA
jgi:IS5 family transposase